jgi:hypothetical protein
VRQWWRRRRLVWTVAVAQEDPVSMTAVATGGVESDGDLESFGMKGEPIWGGVLFIGSKISAVVLN